MYSRDMKIVDSAEKRNRIYSGFSRIRVYELLLFVGIQNIVRILELGILHLI